MRFRVPILTAFMFIMFVVSAAAQSTDSLYTVIKGDTLFRISVRFNVPMAGIIEANSLANPQIIYVGQVLRIPGSATPVFASPNESLSATRDVNADTTVLRYTVASGDTLVSIARRFGTTVAILANANVITNPSRITVGQVLRIVIVGNSSGSSPSMPLSQTTPAQPNLTMFRADSTGVDRTALFNKSVQIPVSWTLVNRPDGTNLVFEQVFENGTKLNVELPRSNPYVASSGQGVVAPVYPADNPNAAQITLRLSLVNIADGTYITFNSISMLLTGAVPSQAGDICRATLNVTTALFSGPGTGYLIVSQVAGGDHYVVRARSGGWYSLDYPVDNSLQSGAWVDGAQVTLSGKCDTLVDLAVPEPTIQSFTVGVTGIERAVLGTERAYLPVAWTVVNRPPRTNLVFEQVHNDGSAVNIELPRGELIVPSTGIGVVKAVEPAVGTSISAIVIRLRLVNLDDQTTLVVQDVSIPIIASTPVPPTQ